MNWPLCAPAAHCTFDRICMEMNGSGADQAGGGRNCRRAGRRAGVAGRAG